jgi:CRISPR-associated protein Csm3
MVRFETSFKTESGLLISAGKSISRIGGSDVEPMSIEKEYQCNDKSFVCRIPYIPGSSFKGRMRSLLELANGLELYSNDRRIWSHTISLGVYKNWDEGSKIKALEFIEILNNSDFDKLFGYGAFNFKDLVSAIHNENKGSSMQDIIINKIITNLQSNLTPTLLYVDDFYPDNNFICNIYNQKKLVTFDDFLEDKNENRIDRISSAADPRTISRVKVGVPFNGSLLLMIYDKTKNNFGKHITYIIQGLSLLEKTYLGANGSRGYGRIKFDYIAVKIYDPTEMKESVLAKYKGTEELTKDKQNLEEKIKNSL